MVRLGLHGEGLEWRLVSVRDQAGLRSGAGEGEEGKPSGVGLTPASLGMWDHDPHNSSGGLRPLLESVKSCESPLCVCRNLIHQKWHKKAG